MEVYILYPIPDITGLSLQGTINSSVADVLFMQTDLPQGVLEIIEKIL